MLNPIMTGEGNKKRYRSLFGLVAGAAGVAMVAACNPVQAEQPQPKPTYEWTLKPTATPQNQPTRSAEEQITNQQKLRERQEKVNQAVENFSQVEQGEFLLNGPTIVEVSENSIVTVAEDNEVAPIILPAGVNVLALNTNQSYVIKVSNPEGETTAFHNLADIAGSNLDETNANSLSVVYKLSFAYNGQPWSLVFSNIDGDFDIEENLFDSDREGEEVIAPEQVASTLAFALQESSE